MRNWLSRLLGRKPRFADSPEHWNPGDLAECIADDTWIDTGSRKITPGPKLGEARIVSSVKLVGGAQFLRFARWPRRTYQATEFRKIIPRADTEPAQDAQFLKSLLPHRQLTDS